MPRYPRIVWRVLASTAFYAVIGALQFLNIEYSLGCLFGIAYDFFAFFCLLWIFPYALLTSRNSA